MLFERNKILRMYMSWRRRGAETQSSWPFGGRNANAPSSVGCTVVMDLPLETKRDDGQGWWKNEKSNGPFEFPRHLSPEIWSAIAPHIEHGNGRERRDRVRETKGGSFYLQSGSVNLP